MDKKNRPALSKKPAIRIQESFDRCIRAHIRLGGLACCMTTVAGEVVIKRKKFQVQVRVTNDAGQMFDPIKAGPDAP